MIKNLPTYDDFEIVAKECLIQSFNLLFKVFNNYEEFDEETIHEEVKLEDLWKYNSGTLRTSIILLHQGIETYMKGVVAKASPLLLLEQKPSDWPTLPKSLNKDYDTLFTIAGENLLHTFCAVTDIYVTPEMISFIEEIRKKRNAAIHGASKLNTTAKDLLRDILQAYTYCFGKDNWFLDFKNFNFENPLFGYFDWEYETLMSYKYLNFVESMLGIKELGKYITFETTGRRYFCPLCKDAIDNQYGNLQNKWAYLYPNSSSSAQVHCINCNKDIVVTRENCVIEECKGNVIDNEGVCLTCYEIQE